MSKLRILLLMVLLSILAACSSNITSEDSQAKASNQKASTSATAYSCQIYFAFDRSTIQSSQAEVLDLQVKKIKAEGIKKITIEGHTDSIGTVVYNIALGERRANATKKYLVSKGINQDMISVVSYGKSKPKSSNDSSSGRSQNRRTVTLFQ